jgi:phosphopantothenoylcysteine synthetase/decarboxylase
MLADDYAQSAVGAHARHVRLLVGVCGSISAVAVPHLVLWMRPTLGVTQVRIVLTRAAKALVGINVMRAVSDHGVYADFDDMPDASAPHVDLAVWADAMVVLPATANFLGKVANGIADDLLTTTLLAADCPVVIVPVMNGAMWAKPAVQRNVAQLRNDGYDVVEPTEGVELAGWRTEVGSLGDYRPALVAAIAKAMSSRDARSRACASTTTNHDREK